MATKPTIFVDYAESALYSIGPEAGEPTKIVLSGQDLSEGNIPGPDFFPSAEKFNFMQNAHGLWIRWLDEEVFSTEDSEFQSRLADVAGGLQTTDVFVVEDSSIGYAKRRVSFGDLLGTVTLKDVMANDPITGANTMLISAGQKIRGINAATGTPAPLIGGDGSTGPGGVGQVGGGDTATGSSAGDGVVSGGEATAGTGTGGDAVMKPGPSFGGVDGRVLFDLPSGDLISWPPEKATVAGQVLTDAAADGNLSWGTPSGGDLEDALALDPRTGPHDIVVSNNQSITGVDGTSGQILRLKGGAATSGPAGEFLAVGGSATTGTPRAATLEGGSATDGTGDGANSILKPGTSAGGTDGKVVFEMPNGDEFFWPNGFGAAGSVPTDAAGDGIMSMIVPAGGLTLSASVQAGNFTATLGTRHRFNPSAGSLTITAPSAGLSVGSSFGVIVSNGDATKFTVAGGGTNIQDMDGAIGGASWIAAGASLAFDFVYDGTNWLMLGIPTVSSKWTAFTPGLVGLVSVGSTGTNSGYWRRVAGAMDVRVHIAFAGSGINTGSGAWGFVLPDSLTVASIPHDHVDGTIYSIDDSTANTYISIPRIASGGTRIEGREVKTSGSILLQSTTPFLWATADLMWLTMFGIPIAEWQ